MKKGVEDLEDLYRRDRQFRQKTLDLHPVFFPPECQQMGDSERQATMERRFTAYSGKENAAPQAADSLSSTPNSSSRNGVFLQAERDTISSGCKQPVPPPVDLDKLQSLKKDNKDATAKINELLTRIREQKDILKHKLEGDGPVLTLAPVTVRGHQGPLATGSTQTDTPKPLKDDATQTSTKKATPPPSLPYRRPSSLCRLSLSSNETEYQSLPSDHGYLEELNDALTESRMDPSDLENIDESTVLSYHQKLFRRASHSMDDAPHTPAAQSSDVEENAVFGNQHSLPSSISSFESSTSELPSPHPQDSHIQQGVHHPKPIHISPLKPTFRDTRDTSSELSPKPQKAKRMFPSIIPYNPIPPFPEKVDHSARQESSNTIPKEIWTPDFEERDSHFASQQDLSFPPSSALDVSVRSSKKVSFPENTETQDPEGHHSSDLESLSPERSQDQTVETEEFIDGAFNITRQIRDLAHDLTPHEYKMLLEELSRRFGHVFLPQDRANESQRRPKPPTTSRIVGFGELLIPTELSTIPELDSRNASLPCEVAGTSHQQTLAEENVSEEEEEENLDTAAILEDLSSSTSTIVPESPKPSPAQTKDVYHGEDEVCCSHSLVESVEEDSPNTSCDQRSSSEHIPLALESSGSKSSDSLLEGRLVAHSTPIKQRPGDIPNIADESEPTMFSFDVSSIPMDASREECLTTRQQDFFLPTPSPQNTQVYPKSKSSRHESPTKEETTHFIQILPQSSSTDRTPSTLVPTANQQSKKFFSLSPMSDHSTPKTKSNGSNRDASSGSSKFIHLEPSLTPRPAQKKTRQEQERESPKSLHLTPLTPEEESAIPKLTRTPTSTQYNPFWVSPQPPRAETPKADEGSSKNSASVYPCSSGEFEPLEEASSSWKSSSTGSSNLQHRSRDRFATLTTASTTSSTSFAPLKATATTRSGESSRSESQVEQWRAAATSSSCHAVETTMTDSLVSFLKHEQSAELAPSPSNRQPKKTPQPTPGYKARTQRLYNNLPEVQEKKEAEERKKALLLNRQRAKEYYSKITKTPK